MTHTTTIVQLYQVDVVILLECLEEQGKSKLWEWKWREKQCASLTLEERKNRLCQSWRPFHCPKQQLWPSRRNSLWRYWSIHWYGFPDPADPHWLWDSSSGRTHTHWTAGHPQEGPDHFPHSKPTQQHNGSFCANRLSKLSTVSIHLQTHAHGHLH